MAGEILIIESGHIQPGIYGVDSSVRIHTKSPIFGSILDSILDSKVVILVSLFELFDETENTGDGIL